jgi:hypothetical protein
MNSSVKLSNSQVVILSAASRREDRCLIAPNNLKDHAAEKVAAKLLAVGLVREIKAKPSMPVWRRDEDAGQAISLKLTAAGLKAISIDEEAQPEQNAAAPQRADEDASSMKGDANLATAKMATMATTPAGPNAAAAPMSPAPRPGTKIARVIELLQHDQGATLETLIVATGWLPHTARAALTGLRHRGYDVRLERGEKGSASVYRIDVSPLTGS